MADLKIYNNGENKVLMSAGDRIIRQPYEFGNSHSIVSERGSLAQYYIQCISPITNINNEDFTVVMFYKPSIAGGNNRGVFGFTSNSYQCALGIGRRPHMIYGIQLDYNKLTETTFGNTTTASIPMPISTAGSIVDAVAFNKDTVTGYRSTLLNGVVSGVLQSSILSFTDESYNYIRIARGQSGIFYYETPEASIYINRFLVFKRVLGKKEIEFIFSNGNGGNPQSYEQLVLDIITNEAEILDFSALQDGSDLRVGCRDYSGFNRHGQIMNLPAGSLEDQLAFANANLFVPFIQ